MALKTLKRPDEDLFGETTMSFGEHLEELRGALFRALIGLMIGFAFGLMVGRGAVLAIQLPLTNALEDYYEQNAREKLQEQLAAAPAGQQDLVPFITNESMIFDEVLVAPAEMYAQIARQYGDTSAAAPLPANPPGHPLSTRGPVSVVPADFKEPVRLAARLSGDDKNLAVKHIAGRLQEHQATLASWGAAEKLSGEEQIAFANMLAGLVLTGDLYDQGAFADVELTHEGRELLAQETREPNEQARLNRLLLEAAFPEEIAPTYRSLVHLKLWRKTAEDDRTRIKSLSAQEVFSLWMKAALIVGALLASPYIFWQIWSFVAAGLYPHERRYVHFFLPASLGLFLAGAAIAFLFVFQPVLSFLLGFNRWMGIDPDPRISEWVGFVLILPLGFGISFQLPLVMLFLERIGVFTPEQYVKQWKISIMVIVVISAVLTPADPYSMLLMAVPLAILYAGGIGLCRWLPRGRNPFDDPVPA